MAERVQVELEVDGQRRTLDVDVRGSLLQSLRDAGHTSVKNGCEEGECGACTVVLDGRLACACLVPAATCDGAVVRTASSMVEPDVAEAFARHGAVQCGFCTPGFVVAVRDFLDKHPDASEAEIRAGLNGNLCRCGTYANVIMAALEVVKGGK